MKTTLALSAAFLLAGAAYVLPAHAQMLQQAPGAASQTQSQPYGSAAHSAQPYDPAGQTQPRAAGQSQSGTMAPSQTRSYGTTGTQMGIQGQLPQGSFRNSCNDIRMAGDTLIAFCPKGDGTWQTTAIGPASQCVGDIQNVNGQLSCNEAGYGSSASPAQAQPAPTQRR
jgi:hypothetical protein